MNIHICKIMAQVYLSPYVKITHNKWLNGHYELIIGWLKWELVISKEATL